MSEPFPSPPGPIMSGLAERHLDQAVVESRPPLLAGIATARLSVACVLVVLVAGVATLSGLLLQNRGVINDTKKALASTRTQLSSTQSELTSTKADLSNTQGELASAQGALKAANDREAKTFHVAFELSLCVQTLAHVAQGSYLDDTQFQQCMSAGDHFGALPAPKNWANA